MHMHKQKTLIVTCMSATDMMKIYPLENEQVSDHSLNLLLRSVHIIMKTYFQLKCCHVVFHFKDQGEQGIICKQTPYK